MRCSTCKHWYRGRIVTYSDERSDLPPKIERPERAKVNEGQCRNPPIAMSRLITPSHFGCVNHARATDGGFERVVLSAVDLGRETLGAHVAEMRALPDDLPPPLGVRWVGRDRLHGLVVYPDPEPVVLTPRLPTESYVVPNRVKA